jgi:predicted molibdopterin-dependent oxidoreductase YjgC
MVKLRIDEKEIETSDGKTILEAARDNGIYIPTLCYHANLLSIGSCRLCIVEIDGYPNPMPSCTTAVQEGMSVRTHSERLFAMRREYLKLILAYHPLECPVCDAGGECDLQNLVFEHGIEKADLSVERERKIDSYATPVIKYWENRCVLCLRCIHACREVSGRGVLDLVGTGIDARMAPTNPKSCISCGECLFVCPVGALTENLSPVKSRVWQVKRHLTTCPNCGHGCTFELDILNGKLVTDVIQNEKNLPNKGSLCVLGRFGYDFVNHEGKIEKPSMKGETVDLAQAVAVARDRLHEIDSAGGGIGFIVSPRATNEELFLIREIAGRFKKASVSTSGHYHTGKVRNTFNRMGISPVFDYGNLLDADLILVAGANLLSNNHVLGDRVREAVKLGGAKIVVVDPSPTVLTAISDLHVKVKPGRDAFLFNGISRRLIEDGKHPTGNEVLEGFVCFFDALKPLEVDAAVKESGIEPAVFDRLFRLVSQATNMAVIIGSGVGASHESLKGLLNLCILKGIDKRGLVMPVARESNALGAVSILNTKSSPHRVMENESAKALFFYEEDPYHYINGETVSRLLDSKEFVLAADRLPTYLTDRADLVVPTGVFIEKNGTFFAEDGHLRSLTKMTPGVSWTGFDFLAELLAKLGGPRYGVSAQVTDQLRKEGVIRSDGDSREQLGVESEAGRFDAQPIPQSLPATEDYLLILRDVGINHHIIDKEAYSKGIEMVYQHPGYPVSEDKLFMSREDASTLGLVEGDVVEVESKSGVVQKPLSIKDGLRPGVLEYIVFKDRRQALKLSAQPTKWIEVRVRKG